MAPWRDPVRGAIVLALLVHAAACVPARGAQPVATWREEDAKAHCDPRAARDLGSSAWSPESRAALSRQIARDAPVVVSALGCRVDVLDHCRAPGRYVHSPNRRDLGGDVVLASAIDGDCTSATHVVRAATLAGDDATPIGVELSALSLADYALTGVWEGAMTQPRGPYEVYDMTLDLVQEDRRVKGTSLLRSIDGVYWGTLRFEGRLEGNVLFFADAEVIDDNLGPLLGWCTKGGWAIVDPRARRIEGPWRAGGCAPGAIELRQKLMPILGAGLTPPRLH